MVTTTTANGIQVKHYQGKVVLHKIPKTLCGEVLLPQDVTHIQITFVALYPVL